jgi:hypothetical protein
LNAQRRRENRKYKKTLCWFCRIHPENLAMRGRKERNDEEEQSGYEMKTQRRAEGIVFSPVRFFTTRDGSHHVVNGTGFRFVKYPEMNLGWWGQ